MLKGKWKKEPVKIETVGSALAEKEARARDTRRFWLGPIGERDDFGAPIKGEFIDGATRRGPWAVMSPKTWKVEGIGVLGLGCGQRYQKQEDGRWLKVEG